MFFGFDPEGFIFKGKKVVGAHHFFPEKGTGKVYRDGFALEVNSEPSGCIANSTIYLKNNLAWAASQLPSGHHLRMTSLGEISPEEMMTAPPDVFEVGCHPCFSAYGVPEREYVDPSSRERYAGGHMHFSHINSVTLPEHASKFVRLLDIFIGLPEAFFFGHSGAWKRRRFYGKAGEFRYAEISSGYGYIIKKVEYRTPGPEMWNHIFFPNFFCEIARKVDAHSHTLSTKVDTDAVRGAIETGEGVEKLMEDYCSPLLNVAGIRRMRDVLTRRFASPHKWKWRDPHYYGMNHWAIKSKATLFKI